MKSTQEHHIFNPAYKLPLLIGILFLTAYWLFGFDGITFSDDVYYLLAGKKFWEGTMEVSNYHFSSRWGAYVPAGLIGYLFGFDAHRVSLISLLSYAASLLLVLKILPKSAPAWVLVLWFCTQVYFLHFLTKVYPDSLLVLWTCLVPAAATFRKTKPVYSGMLLVLALFIGFLTKETIVLLAPFPILLFYFDWKRKELTGSFYISILLTGILLSVAYLGYFWVKFGDPLHRISSINAGHYISEFTYADKGFWAIMRRITILPIITFVERSYWAWMVFALPGIALGLKSKKTPAFEFSLTFLCLLFGFWFMSSTLEFYNPIYLNPRHLIIIMPILSMLIAIGWKEWKNSRKWKIYFIGLLLLGTGISLVQMDLKMAVFNAVLLVPVLLRNQKLQLISLLLILILPAIYSIYFQQNLKQYDNLIKTLTVEMQITDSKESIYTHSFLDFSKEVMFEGNLSGQNQLLPFYTFPTDPNQFPAKLKVLIYDYYHHAYPEEQEDMDTFSNWLSKHYELLETREIGNISVSEYVRK